MNLLQILEDQHFDQDECGVDCRENAFDGVLSNVAVLVDVRAVLGVGIVVSMQDSVVTDGSVTLTRERDASDLLFVSDCLENDTVGTYKKFSKNL